MMSRRIVRSLRTLCLTNSSNERGSRVVLNRRLCSGKVNQDVKHVLSKNTGHKYSANCQQIRYMRTNCITKDNIVLSPYDDLELTNCLIHESVWKNVDKWSDKVAIECGVTKRSYTFAQLRRYSKTFAASLIRCGLQSGEIISIILPNIPEYPIAVLGALEAGLVVSTINPAYNVDEIYNQLTGSNPACIVTNGSKLNTVQQAISKYEQKQKFSTSVKIISMQNDDGVSREYPSGVWSLQEMFQSDIDTSIIDSLTHSKTDDVAILPYSSGTTGLPKGVCLSHRNVVGNLEAISQKYNSLNLDTTGNFQDVSIGVLPFFHLYGLSIIMLQQLRLGGKLVSLPKFDPQQYLKALKDYNITILHLVPPLLMFIGTHPNASKDMFEQVHDVISAAAPLRENETNLFLKHFNQDVAIRQGYGLTETSPFITLTPCGVKSLSTVGPPLSLTEVKIIDPENGKSLQVGEHGEICARGPQVMKGYLNNPEATASTIDKDGWLHSGDIGYYDKNGYFYIVDRIKELIKVKGFQVAPAELEELLRCHPKVADAAVIGVPDERAGETPIAFVVTKQQTSIVQDELINYVSEHVTKYKRISKIIFTDSIPKSASGKILRRSLKDSYSRLL